MKVEVAYTSRRSHASSFTLIWVNPLSLLGSTQSAQAHPNCSPRGGVTHFGEDCYHYSVGSGVPVCPSFVNAGRQQAPRSSFDLPDLPALLLTSLFYDVQKEAAPADKTWGFLVKQSNRQIIGGATSLTQVDEVYLHEVAWEELGDERNFFNGMDKDVAIDMHTSKAITNSESTERADKLGFSAELQGLGFTMEGEHKVIQGNQTTKDQGQTVKLTVGPHKSLFRYHQLDKFWVRSWWYTILEDGVPRVVCKTGSNTFHGWSNVTTRDGTTWASNTEATGEKTLHVSEIVRTWNDSSMGKTSYSELPVDFKWHIDFLQRIASGEDVKDQYDAKLKEADDAKKRDLEKAATPIVMAMAVNKAVKDIEGFFGF
ncbi:LOW QUALITY PROTEIN: hypothetical protein RSAG8_10940, partial [Rhizoctonia solani AG-8 WAC10335]